MITDFNRLPEGCIAHVISLTSARDACVSCAVSSTFRSAADSDAVWERFLPSDFSSIQSRAVEPVRYPSKKALFLRLCDDPVLIDGGKWSFGLDRSSGAKCFMISARALDIVGSGDERHWKWTLSGSQSRFPEVAELIMVRSLEICVEIETKILSPYTVYAAYLIFKLAYGVQRHRAPPQVATITIGGQSMSQHSLCLQQNKDLTIPQFRSLCGQSSEEITISLRRWTHMEEVEAIGAGVKLPRKRGDRWMEIELGEFYNENGEDGMVAISFKGRGGHWKNGLIVQGIEIKPKS